MARRLLFSLLREGREQRAALKEAFGISPEEWQARWEERITGKRRSIAPTPEEMDAARPEAPGARERAEIRAETDPDTLAAEQPSGDFGRQLYRTNYVDALRLLLDEKKGRARSGGFQDTPDTVFFLTDGKPTVGDINEPEVLLSWFAERNRFARMHFNVITFGSQETNDRFLRRLAEENGGKFVQVHSAK